MLHLFRRSAPPSPDLGALLEQQLAPIATALAGLTELVQKSSRAQGKLGLRLEELERKVEGGFSTLQSRPSATERSDLKFDEILDALDLLDEGIRTSEQESVREGLRLVSTRLSTFLGRQGVTRLAPEPGTAVDGKRFRVVGSIDADLPEGTVARLVRAAVMQHQQLLREGELLVAQRQS